MATPGKEKPSKSNPPRRTPAAAPNEIPDGLQDEIRMLRNLMRRIRALADEGRPLPELLRILETLGKSSTRLATLLKTERLLAGDEDFGQALNDALKDVIRDLTGEPRG